MSEHLIEASKFLSYVLRHEPEAIGITLDREGWADIELLIAAASTAGKWLDRELIATVVVTSDKKRFAFSDDGLRIRAVQGHSTASVDIDFVAQVPPEFLYHGTATRFLESIQSSGLVPGSRKYVHLSENEETALSVGSRYGKPVALKVSAGVMQERGFKFYRAENGVWLTLNVPAGFVVD
ncbi:MAG: 2-phosphotransferase [Herminiimonas sp.]|nr:2-phosphotransferase [Herminiimonas sp.]